VNVRTCNAHAEAGIHGLAREGARHAILLLALFLAFSPALRASETVLSQLDELRALEEATITAIEKAKPAFVFIGGGSGFSISPDGWVLTNYHVIESQRDIRVFFTGGKSYRADIAGVDSYGDVALLKLRDAKDLPYLELGDSDSVRPGDRVIALGDPFLLGSENLFLRPIPPDYEPSASLGVVSAVHRYSDSYSDAIQVDVAVNRGNSGGPLLSLDGKALGINGKIETRFALGINTGVGYAIPANQIRRFLDHLKRAEGGDVKHGTILGLEVAERADGEIGLPVSGVEDGSPAQAIGFQSGDLLVRIAGQTARTRSRYLGILSTYPAGERIPLTVHRGGEELEIEAVLVAPGRPFLGVRTRLPESGDPGAEITAVTPRSPAARASLEAGDIIFEVGGEGISSPTELARHLGGKNVGEEVVLKVRRGDRELEVTVRLGTAP